MLLKRKVKQKENKDKDVNCKCTQKGIPSEWTWDIEQKCHICSSCGVKQY